MPRSTTASPSFRSLALGTLALGALALVTVACGGNGTAFSDVSTSGSGTGAGSGGGTGSGGGSGSAGGAGGAGGAGSTSSGTTSSTSTGNPGGCHNPTPGATPACASYTTTTIAAMRAGQTSGCFELSNVGLVARTDSPSEPRLYVQDPGGGDFSAIVAKCSPTASHACAAPVQALIPGLYDTFTDGEQLTIRGYYINGGVTGFESVLIEDIIDECATVPRPAPIDLSVANIQRDARTPAKWFMRAHVAIPQNDPLVMYDFSPLDLQAPVQGCPEWLGFAMIPKSAGVAAPQGCSGTTNPASRPNDPREVLVGRQYFNQFLYSTDCGCAPGTGQILVSPSGKVSGTVTGYLILEVDANSTNAYQVFEAAADQVFPIQ